MATMHELEAAYKQLLNAAEGLNNDVFEDTLSSIKDGIEDKAQGYAAVIAELQGEADKRKKEIDRITAQKRTIEYHIVRMKQNLLHAMETAGIKKVDGLFKVHVRSNAPHAVIDDDSKIPVDFIKTEYKVDKKKILQALKSDCEVPGARIERNQSLQIS